jgi:hypothetical protein
LSDKHSPRPGVFQQEASLQHLIENDSQIINPAIRNRTLRKAPRATGHGFSQWPGANIASGLLSVLFIFCPAKKIFKDFK